MTSRLAQSEQGFEDVHASGVHAAVGDSLQQRRAVVIAELVVAFAVGWQQLDLQSLLSLRGEVLEDFFLRAAEDERGHAAAKRLERGVVLSIGTSERLERRAAAEHAGVEELEDRPEI